MEADAGTGEPAEPFHGRALVARAAGSGVDLAADAAADDATFAIDEVPIDAGTVIGVFFRDGKIALRGGVAPFPGGNGRVDENLVAGQEIEALFREGDDGAGVFGIDDVREVLVHDGFGLAIDEAGWLRHSSGEKRFGEGIGREAAGKCDGEDSVNAEISHVAKDGGFISASFRCGNQFIEGRCGADCQGAAGGLHRNTRSRIVEKFPSFFICPWVAAVLFFLKPGLAPMAAGAPKLVVAPAPPQPVEQKVTVRRGGSVEVPLKIYGTRAQTLSWIIKRPPGRGKLSEVRATGAESAVVTYRPPADLGVVSDRFTFSVRSNEGVSAPVEVAIAILDDAPRIGGLGELDFGTVLMGTSAAKTLEFFNSGGGMADGMFEVGAPWRAEGPRDYKLAAGQKRSVKIVFAPERAGRFESQVKFTSQADAAVILRGVAEDALAVAPAELVLTHDEGRPLRVGVFEIRNNTEGAMEVAISAGPRLVVKKTLQLAAHDSAALTVQTAEKDAGALEDTMEISAGVLVAHLRVKTPALPAMVRARSDRVVFRHGNANAKERVVFENLGGTESRVTLAVGSPFSVDESSFSLAAGGEKEVEISLKGESPAGAQAVLKVRSDGRVFDIPVVAVGPARAESVSAVPRARKSAPTQVNREEEARAESEDGAEDATAKVVDSITGTSARLRWKGEWPDGVEFRCLQRYLSLDEEGELVVTFQEYSACRFSRQNGVNVARFEKLDPGQEYFFRIDEVSAAGSNPVVSAQIRTPLPPVRKKFFSLMPVMILLAIGAGGVSIWRRIRTRSRSGF